MVNPVRAYDAVVFDLLTALLDSWTLWNTIAGSDAAGLAWRRRYLELTYAAGTYRPYLDIVEAAAVACGQPAAQAATLGRRFGEVSPSLCEALPG